MVLRFTNSKSLLFLISFALLVSCHQKQKGDKTASGSKKGNKENIEAITLLGDTLRTPPIKGGKSKDNYETALKAYKKYPDSAETLVWYGRRTAYLGHFQRAIAIYSEGIQKFPEDARLYRHRGHRYISTRQYDKAIIDFKKAADLLHGLPDQTEPDGLPNSRNIPISTLKGNIWYHLGLAYYLKGNMKKALAAYQKREVTNTYDDNLVSGGHWLFMILKRLGRDSEALLEIADVDKNMDIIENTRYYEMCLFYKGLLKETELKMIGDGSSSDDVYYYGLGNWNLYENKDTLKAKRLYKKLLEDGNPYSFAYLAAEVDWKRLFE
ncbi:MAG: tetratricopeptide repeat protein [Bacteroidota bacterium]